MGDQGSNPSRGGKKLVISVHWSKSRWIELSIHCLWKIVGTWYISWGAYKMANAIVIAKGKKRRLILHVNPYHIGYMNPLYPFCFILKFFIAKWHLKNLFQNKRQSISYFMLGFKAFFSFHRLVFLLAIQRLTLEYFLARVLLGLIYSSSVGQLLTFCTTPYHISLIYVSNFLYTWYICTAFCSFDEYIYHFG